MNGGALKLLGSFGGSGLSRFMPGTCGTLAASLVIAAIELNLEPVWWWMLVAGLGVFALGVPLATASVRKFGNPDPQWFVLDEVAGVLLATAGLSHLTGVSLLYGVGAGFFYFRIFDILKPWPIRRIEKIGVGFGVMIDDIAAAALAWPCAYATLHFLG